MREKGLLYGEMLYIKANEHTKRKRNTCLDDDLKLHILYLPYTQFTHKYNHIYSQKYVCAIGPRQKVLYSLPPNARIGQYLTDMDEKQRKFKLKNIKINKYKL